MKNTFGSAVSLTIFGESHGPAVGVVLDGLAPGVPVDEEYIRRQLSRRRPSTAMDTPRQEPDHYQICSGVWQGRTTGTPIAIVIPNENTRSGDYTYGLARPSHADYAAYCKYHGYEDWRGGGHFSGRLTAPLCFAGAVCGQILERRGIYTGAHIASVHGISDDAFSRTKVTKEDILEVRGKDFPVRNDAQGEKMKEDIRNASQGGESLGGIIECVTINMPAGVGSPIFEGLENTIAQLIFGIPAVKGLEFGAGFQVAEMVGSQNNDPFYIDENGHVKTKTNNHGGILGGISSGMPITLNVAIKPTASIAKPQETVDFRAKKNETLQIHGRHDPCIVPRAVPCVEAAVNIALLSHMMDYPNF